MRERAATKAYCELEDINRAKARTRMWPLDTRCMRTPGEQFFATVTPLPPATARIPTPLVTHTLGRGRSIRATIRNTIRTTKHEREAKLSPPHQEGVLA